MNRSIPLLPSFSLGPALLAAGVLLFGGPLAGRAWAQQGEGQVVVEDSEPDSAPEQDSLSPSEPRRPQAGDTVKFIFTSGDTSEAQIVRVDETLYRVMIGGLSMDVRFSDIEDVIVLPSVAERFRQMRALIEATDLDSMEALAAWAFERGLYDQAITTINEAILAAPDKVGLKEARDLLVAQIELARVRRAREAERELDELFEPKPDEDGGATRVPRPYPNFPLLTDEQINLVKVYEVNLRRPPRILIERATIDALLEHYAEHPLLPTTREGRDAFRRRPPNQILDIMFRIQARDLYPEVKIVGHPAGMTAFRDHVHVGWLVNNCSTNRCHGGERARDFILYNKKPASSGSVYTNFLIIERYQTAEGRPLIDYQSPDRSLLLEMGLAREDAVDPHPDVEGWKPVFHSRDSRAFQRAVRWIQMMYRPRPEHPIEYFPPGRSDAQPSLDLPEDEPIER